MSVYLRRLLAFLCVLALASGAFKVFGQTGTISSIVRQANGQVRLSLGGVSLTPVALQFSADLKTWTTLQTFTLAGIPTAYTDSQPGAIKGFYRLHDPVMAVQLADLATLPNAV